MTLKIPSVNPQHYLLPQRDGRLALKNLRLKFPDPAKWVYQEQQLNDRTISSGDYPIQPTSVPPDFRPEVRPVFWLPEFEAPKDHFRLYRNPQRSPPWYFAGSHPDFYSHLVHPLTVSYFRSRKLKGARWRSPRFLATPMASHRSLLVWSPSFDVHPFAAKTSVNIWIGGLNRNVRLLEIRRSVGMSSLLAGIPKADLERQGILLLDDPVGLVHKNTNAGLLARDIPWKLERGEEIVPVFSLIASGHGQRPRIVDLIKSSRLSATAWVDRFVLTPLIYQAYFMGMTEGLVGEMHEQNILMELRNGKPTRRFWHRDLGGFGVDRELRRLANKGFEELPNGIFERHLGKDCSLLHLLLRMYLQESMGFAVAQALRKHFKIATKDFAELYNVRVSELQSLIFSANGVSAQRDFETELELYRDRKKPCLSWLWKSLEAALREWRPKGLGKKR